MIISLFTNRRRSRNNREDGKISLYHFIASEYVLPELISPKIHRDGERISAASEDDLYDLEICSEPLEDNYRDITFYTKLPYIYSINFRYTEERIQRLYHYLINNCKRGKKCQIWTVWLANCKTNRMFLDSISKELENLRKKMLSLNELHIDDLNAMFCHANSDETSVPAVIQIY